LNLHQALVGFEDADGKQLIVGGRLERGPDQVGESGFCPLISSSEPMRP
jgi:hypothetical protein